MDPDQAPYFVGPDLGPKYLQRLSADDTSRQRVRFSLGGRGGKEGKGIALIKEMYGVLIIWMYTASPVFYLSICHATLYTCIHYSIF